MLLGDFEICGHILSMFIDVTCIGCTMICLNLFGCIMWRRHILSRL